MDTEKKMLRIDFSEEDINELNHERFHHPHPRVALKMEVLYLKSLKLSHNEICRIAKVNENTLLSYLRAYKKGGVEKLKELSFYRPQSKLLDYKGSIENYFRENPPSTTKEAQSRIEELTGIKRGLTQTRTFMKKIGLKQIKVGTIPSKAMTDEKKKNKKNIYQRS